MNSNIMKKRWTGEMLSHVERDVKSIGKEIANSRSIFNHYE